MFEENLFTDQVAVITGGGTGLGKETALALARAGAKIVILGRNEEHLSEGKAEIGRETSEVISIRCDIREVSQLKDARAEILEHYQKINILVNNAAGNFLYPAEKLPIKGWNAVIDIVLNGSFYCSQIFGQAMIKQKSGQILNILATYAWMGGPGTIHSASAKAGVLAMTRTLAVEWARFGIRVNAVAPGPFDTPGARERLWPVPQLKDRIVEDIPMGRFASLQEVANAIIYLLSPYASYINGECLTIDGGAWLGKGIGRLTEIIDQFPEWQKARQHRKR